MSELKRYTFSQIAKMECAECTTSITTTLPKIKYFLAPEADAALKAKDEEIARLRKLLGESGQVVQDYINEIYDNGGVEYRGYSSLLDRIRVALDEGKEVKK